jgi:putative zinc finger/helix-turn-helix YgiT family protein
MKCIKCNVAELESRLAHLPIEVKGETFSIEMLAKVCPNCEYATLDGSRMSEYMRLGADAYRNQHNRLTSAEIKGRRNRLRMTQEQFAKYLHVGPISVKRWELGQVQDAAMDELVKLKTDSLYAHVNYERVARMMGTVPLTGIIDDVAETEWRFGPRKQYELVGNWEQIA